MNELEKARDFFSKDIYATATTGIVIDEVGENYAKCSLKINESHFNAANSVMGGVMYTMADFAFAVAANHSSTTNTVTTVSQISYLCAPKGDTLFAEAKLIKDGSKVCFYEVTVTDNLENTVAIANTTGTHI